MDNEEMENKIQHIYQDMNDQIDRHKKNVDVTIKHQYEHTDKQIKKIVGQSDSFQARLGMKFNDLETQWKEILENKLKTTDSMMEAKIIRYAWILIGITLIFYIGLLLAVQA